jgi:hypothetical protein
LKRKAPAESEITKAQSVAEPAAETAAEKPMKDKIENETETRATNEKSSPSMSALSDLSAFDILEHPQPSEQNWHTIEQISLPMLLGFQIREVALMLCWFGYVDDREKAVVASMVPEAGGKQLPGSSSSSRSTSSSSSISVVSSAEVSATAEEEGNQRNQHVKQRGEESKKKQSTETLPFNGERGACQSLHLAVEADRRVREERAKK